VRPYFVRSKFMARSAAHPIAKRRRRAGREWPTVPDSGRRARQFLYGNRSPPYNALYAYGEGRAFGFSPFAADSLSLPQSSDAEPGMMQVYGLLASISDLLPGAEAAEKTRGLVLHATNWRPTQTVALGGYLFQAALSRSWPAGTSQTQNGAMLILQSAPNEFYVIGSGLTVSFTRDPDVDSGVAGIESVERVSRTSGRWVTETRLNGDQTNQGRQLLMDPHIFQMYRVRLYSIYPDVKH
jgi:Domain of unknown function (DUF5597)